jgi:hypothetical protein
MFEIIKQNYKLVIIIIIIIFILFFITFENFTNEHDEHKHEDNEHKHEEHEHKHEPYDNPDDVMIVISRYNEDLEWLKEEPFNKYPVIVYNKGINDDFYKSPMIKKIINLENVGREGHTYLYHIITNFHNLNNITLFLPGSTDNETKINYTLATINEIEQTHDAAFILHETDETFFDFQLDNWESTNDRNKNINSDNKLKESEYRPMGSWFEKYFNHLFLDKTSHWGIFSVNKNTILKNNIKHYIKFLNQIDDHHNPEVGHYIERCWHAILHPE